MVRKAPVDWPKFTEVKFAEWRESPEQSLKELFEGLLPGQKVPWWAIKNAVQREHPSYRDEFFDWLQEYYPDGLDIPFRGYGVVPSWKATKWTEDYLGQNYQTWIQAEAEEGRRLLEERTRTKGWAGKLSEEDRGTVDDYISMLNSQREGLGQTQLSDNETESLYYMFAQMTELRDSVEQYKGMSLSEFLESPESAEITTEIFAAFPETLVPLEQEELEYQRSLYEQGIEARGVHEARAEAKGRIVDWTRTEFRDLPPELREQFVNYLTQTLIPQKREEELRTTGRDLGDEEILGGLTESEIGDIMTTATMYWGVGAEERIPGTTIGMGRLHSVANLQGMSDDEYLTTTYQEWKSRLHPEYINRTTESDMWSAFVGEELGKIIVRDEQALSGETPGAPMTSSYRYGYPPTAGEVRRAGAHEAPVVRQPAHEMPAERPVRIPTGEVAPKEPEGVFRRQAQPRLTEEKAMGIFESFTTKNPAQQRYLMGFFPGYWQDFLGATSGREQTPSEWRKFLGGVDLRGLLPAAAAKKTGFV